MTFGDMSRKSGAVSHNPVIFAASLNTLQMMMRVKVTHQYAKAF